MAVTRLIVLVLAASIVFCVALGFITGNRRHYDRAWRLAKFGLAALVLFFGVLIVSELVR
jgi:NADH:ubiquinone oxidoreductase subunit 6 (subunit J)